VRSTTESEHKPEQTSDSLLLKFESAPGFDRIAAPLRPLACFLDDLKPDLSNARVHSDRQISDLAAALNRFGQLKPIVVDASTGVVVAGNATLSAAKSLGWRVIAAVRVDPSSTDLKRFALADNRLADLSEFDPGMLSDLLQSIGPDNLDGLGFTLDEFDAFTASKTITADDEDSPNDDEDDGSGGSIDVGQSSRVVEKVIEDVRVDFSPSEYAVVRNAIHRVGRPELSDAEAIVIICKDYCDRRK
jgi:hypothetical protein